jgi:pimeloyl-ACP methyl ester carboxylesterase
MTARGDMGGPARFSEGFVAADGFEIRYFEAGSGPALVCLHGAGGLRLGRGHKLLAAQRRVIAFELPGFGASPPNERTRSLAELAGTMAAAVAALGVERYDLWGISFGGKLALWLALRERERIEALVLSSPAAIRLEERELPVGEELRELLYAHPERAPLPAAPREVELRQRALAQRLIGPAREPELEEAMRELELPVLVLFGSEDRLTPPELGRHYRELLPQAHFVIVYDAAHALDVERPEAFAALTGDFLNRHSEFLVKRESALLYP